MILWLTGKTMTGKSTFLRESKIDHLSIGHELRKRYSEAQFVNTENPMAPEHLDMEVLEMVMNYLCDHASEELVVIDGFPRKIKQLNQVIASAPDNVRSVIAVVHSDDASLRDPSPERSELVGKRRVVEGVVFEHMIYHFINSLSSGSFPENVEMKLVDVTGLEPTDWMTRIMNTVSISANNSVDFMFKKHMELDSLYKIRYGFNTAEAWEAIGKGEAEYKHVAFLKDMLVRMKEEVSEAYDEVHAKFWENKEIDVRALRVEMVDVLHFILTVCATIGMTSYDIGSSYLGKRAVNEGRIFNGKSEGDDAHVGTLLK